MVFTPKDRSDRSEANTVWHILGSTNRLTADGSIKRVPQRLSIRCWKARVASERRRCLWNHGILMPMCTEKKLRVSELHVIFHGFGTSNHLTFVLLEAYSYACMWCSSITQDSTEVINDSSLSVSLLQVQTLPNTSLEHSMEWSRWSPVVVGQEFKVSHWLLLQKVLVLGTSPANQKRANPRG